MNRLGIYVMDVVEINIGGKIREFPLGVSLLLYGPVGSGKTSFCINLTKEFLGNKLSCIWICLDESPLSIRDKLKFFNIDYKYAEDHKLLKYIDVYSEQITGRPLHDPAVINCTSVLNLNELNMALRKALNELKGQGLVIFDSLSTLLLYINSSVCEEFLKVHVNRITSSKYTGIFILQENIHEVKTEETFKMMMDGVLEFGLEEGRRRVGIDKLPLGTSSEWIRSSIPPIPEERREVYEKPRPRKYIDSGGFLEDVQQARVGAEWPGVEGARETEGRPTGRYRETGIIKTIQPEIIHAQTIKLEGVNLKLELQKNINELLNEQVSLRDALHGHDREMVRNADQLDRVREQITEADRVITEIEDRKTALQNTIKLKKRGLDAVDVEIGEIKRIYEENIRKSGSLEEKIKSISAEKQMLEKKLKDATGEDMTIELHGLEQIRGDVKKQVEKSKARLDSLVKKREFLEKEAGRLGKEVEDIHETIESREEEVKLMKNKESKIESEIDLIKRMRVETDAKLKDIVEKRRIAEEKLEQIAGNSVRKKGG